MHKVSLALAVIGTALSVTAQTCNGAPAARVLSNRQDFVAEFFFNIGAHLFDLNVQVPITISGTSTWLYDQGIGAPIVPNQIGNTSIVDIYTCPTTRLGNEALNPANPGSPWTLLGSGTMIVVDTRVGNGESVAVFNPPLSLPAGQYGVSIVYNAPTTGQNPGPLHCLGKGLSPGTPYTDPFLTMTADTIQGVAWNGLFGGGPNLRINYLPAALSAQYVPFGDGCYFRPQAFYESFPNGAATPDLANTGMQLVKLPNAYLVMSASVGYVAPTSTALSAGPTGSTSSANWDDALSLPITMPFNFVFPGGNTSVITISSNGAVLLANVVDNSYAVCGGSYGNIAPFRDGPPRIAAFHLDLDPTVGGGVYYDVDPSNNFVRVTWENVQEWSVAAAVNTMQVTLHVNGNVDIHYGVLGNQGGGNNAIAGFTPGLGSSLLVARDISAALPFQTGDGAIPPVLSMSARPVLGTTTNITTTNLMPGTNFQVFVTALGGVAPPGVPLNGFGMPGCSMFINQALIVSTFLDGTFAVPFAIPNNATFQDAQFYFQAALLTAGLNAAGILTSNGLCAKLGQ